MMLHRIFAAKDLGQTQRVPVEAKTSLELMLFTLLTPTMAERAKWTWTNLDELFWLYEGIAQL